MSQSSHAPPQADAGIQRLVHQVREKISSRDLATSDLRISVEDLEWTLKQTLQHLYAESNLRHLFSDPEWRIVRQYREHAGVGISDYHARSRREARKFCTAYNLPIDRLVDDFGEENLRSGRFTSALLQFQGAGVEYKGLVDFATAQSKSRRSNLSTRRGKKRAWQPVDLERGLDDYRASLHPPLATTTTDGDAGAAGVEGSAALPADDSQLPQIELGNGNEGDGDGNLTFPPEARSAGSEEMEMDIDDGIVVASGGFGSGEIGRDNGVHKLGEDNEFLNEDDGVQVHDGDDSIRQITGIHEPNTRKKRKVGDSNSLVALPSSSPSSKRQRTDSVCPKSPSAAPSEHGNSSSRERSVEAPRRHRGDSLTQLLRNQVSPLAMADDSILHDDTLDTSLVPHDTPDDFFAQYDDPGGSVSSDDDDDDMGGDFPIGDEESFQHLQKPSMSVGFSLNGRADVENERDTVAGDVDNSFEVALSRSAVPVMGRNESPFEFRYKSNALTTATKSSLNSSSTTASTIGKAAPTIPTPQNPDAITVDPARTLPPISKLNLMLPPISKLNLMLPPISRLNQMLPPISKFNSIHRAAVPITQQPRPASLSDGPLTNPPSALSASYSSLYISRINPSPLPMSSAPQIYSPNEESSPQSQRHEEKCSHPTALPVERDQSAALAKGHQSPLVGQLLPMQSSNFSFGDPGLGVHPFFSQSLSSGRRRRFSSPGRLDHVQASSVPSRSNFPTSAIAISENASTSTSKNVPTPAKSPTTNGSNKSNAAMKGPIDSTPEPGGGDNDDDRDAMDPFDLNLHPDHLNRLRNNEMLDDRLIAHLLRCFSVAANSWAIVDSLHLLQMPPPDKLKALYASKETLFIPVHHQNAAAHWSCLVVTNPNISPVAHHYDSCPNPSHSAAARDYVTDIFDVLQPRRLQPRRMVIFRDVNSARQRNGVDCGIFVLVNAIYLLLGLQPPATDVDSNLWRRVFAAMLCSKDQQHMSDLSEAIKRRSPVAIRTCRDLLTAQSKSIDGIDQLWKLELNSVSEELGGHRTIRITACKMRSKSYDEFLKICDASIPRLEKSMDLMQRRYATYERLVQYLKSGLQFVQVEVQSVLDEMTRAREEMEARTREYEDEARRLNARVAELKQQEEEMLQVMS